MKDQEFQPNLASRSHSQVVSIYTCRPILGALPINSGRKNKILGYLSRLPFLRNETSHLYKPNCWCQPTMCPLKVDLLSVTFDPETAEILSIILTNFMKIQHFPSLPGFPHKGHWTQANQILPHVRGLRGLISTVKIFGKFVFQNFRPHPKLKFLTTFVTTTVRTRHHISPERNVVSTNQNANVNLQCIP